MISFSKKEYRHISDAIVTERPMVEVDSLFLGFMGKMRFSDAKFSLMEKIDCCEFVEIDCDFGKIRGLVVERVCEFNSPWYHYVMAVENVEKWKESEW